MKCKRCCGVCKKSGKQDNGGQKYQCKTCGLYQQGEYVYQACVSAVHDQFSRMNRLGCGTNKMADFLGISINTLQKWIFRALTLQPTLSLEENKVYDIDELQTPLLKINSKIWVAYVWDVVERRAVALHIGGRSVENLKNIVDVALMNKPSRINTDNHPTYGALIPKNIHRKGKRKANHIEREHRNMRKDIAYLIRKTMCFAKKKEMLEARIKWYFWGDLYPRFFLEK